MNALDLDLISKAARKQAREPVHRPIRSTG